MDIRQVAKLAHLEITDAEVEMYTPQMADIVKYVEQLNEVDTENVDREVLARGAQVDVEPMLGGLTSEGEATVTIREDVPRECLGQKAALSQAPSAVEGHFQVPKVLG